MIWKLTAIVFITNLVFLWARTWNVRATASRDVWGVMWSGTIVHLSWLISIAIGANSITNIILDWQWQNIIVVIGSLSGGLLGSYFGLLQKSKS
jgi:hypothetical protein